MPAASQLWQQPADRGYGNSASRSCYHILCAVTGGRPCCEQWEPPVEGLAFPGLQLHIQKSKVDHATACWEGALAVPIGAGHALSLVSLEWLRHTSLIFYKQRYNERGKLSTPAINCGLAL
jgi:hypothetical protein